MVLCCFVFNWICFREDNLFCCLAASMLLAWPPKAPECGTLELNDEHFLQCCYGVKSTDGREQEGKK